MAEQRSLRAVLARLGRDRVARWAMALILVLYLAAMFANVLSPYPPDAQPDPVAQKLLSPSPAHPFGTDAYSRDVLSRMLYGARISLSVATLAVLLSASIGLAYGLAAGFAGGRVDAVMMRLLDALLSIPRLLLLIAMLALWPRIGLIGLVILIGVTGWFAVSRLVRAEVLALKERDFVLAARALGASGGAIVRRHLLPNVLAPVIVASTLGVGNVIVLEAGLTYLGIGAPAPTASWGSILNDGGDSFATAWWLMLFPGLAIILTVLAFNTVGDALRDALDPRQVDGVAGAPVAADDHDVQRETMPQRA